MISFFTNNNCEIVLDVTCHFSLYNILIKFINYELKLKANNKIILIFFKFYIQS